MTTVEPGFLARPRPGREARRPLLRPCARTGSTALGVTQILTPRWLVSLNPRRSPTAASSAARTALRASSAPRCPSAIRARRSPRDQAAPIGDLGSRSSLRADTATTGTTGTSRRTPLEFGYSRYFGESWLVDAYGAATTRRPRRCSTATTRDRDHTFRATASSALTTTSPLGARWPVPFKQVPGKYEVKLNGAYEFVRFKFKDFTDIRTGSPYGYNASVLQLFLTGTF